MDAEQVDIVPITLPAGAHVDLAVEFEARAEFCDKYRRIGHSEANCWAVEKGLLKVAGHSTQRGWRSRSNGQRPKVDLARRGNLGLLGRMGTCRMVAH